MPHSSRHSHSQSAVDNGKDEIGEAGDAVASVVDQARQSVHDVADRAQAAGSQAADYVRHQYEDLSGRARDTYSKTRNAIRECEDATLGYVKQSPLTTILVAVGVGFLLGLIWRRHD